MTRGGRLARLVGAPLLAACAPEPPPPCAWSDAPALEVGRDVAVATLPPEGSTAPIDYGNPPQGGAPYAPLQVRLRAEIDELPFRGELHATVRDAVDGEEIGSAAQAQAFVCSNTGPHEGWLYGGELHLRFWDRSLEELSGRAVAVRVELALPDGDEVVARGGGILTWTLGAR
jgi:hypothetical protein